MPRYALLFQTAGRDPVTIALAPTQAARLIPHLDISQQGRSHGFIDLSEQFDVQLLVVPDTRHKPSLWRRLITTMNRVGR